MARGRYIVEDVAVCSQCHTPHNSPTSLDRMKWLQGAALWFKPAMPAGDWPLEAPRIAGIVPGTDEDIFGFTRHIHLGVWLFTAATVTSGATPRTCRSLLKTFRAPRGTITRGKTTFLAGC